MNRHLRELLWNQRVVDLGTSSSRVADATNGAVVAVPTIVAVDASNNQVLAIGQPAQEMIDRQPPSIKLVRPVALSVIADYDVTETILRHALKMLKRKRQFANLPSRILLAIPATPTSVEKRTFVEVAMSAGARQVWLVDQLLAAAVGSGVAILKTKATLIVDIGAGTTKVAVIQKGKIVFSKTSLLAGDELTELIRRCLRDEHGLMVGWPTAEYVKQQVVSVHVSVTKKRQIIRGKDALTGLPKQLSIGSEQLRDAIVRELRVVIDLLRLCLEGVPASQRKNIQQEGLYIVGGGALLSGLAAFLREELKLPVQLAVNAQLATTEGAIRMLQQLKLYGSVCKNSHEVKQ